MKFDWDFVIFLFWYDLVWISMVWYGPDGFDSNTISQSVTRVGIDINTILHANKGLSWTSIDEH